MTKELVLDLGIGKGGEYIYKDPEAVCRIGLDNNRSLFYLIRYGERPPALTNVAMVNADAVANLPLSSDSKRFILVVRTGQSFKTRRESYDCL